MNVTPGFADAASGTYTLASGSALIDQGLIIPGINDGYRGAAPDLGAFEFAPDLELTAAAAHQAIRLGWSVNVTLPVTSTWRINYTGPPGDQLSPITNITEATRSYTLSGLTNYTSYTVTLNAMLDSSPILTDTVTVMPTDRLIYLPVILRTP